MEETQEQSPPPSMLVITKDLLKKGGIAVAFRLSQPFIQGFETACVAYINSSQPGSLAALGLAHPTRHFLTHTPGSFFNLTSQKFTDAKNAGNDHTANLWFASHLAGLTLDIPTILAMVWAGDFFKVVGIDPVVCDNLTKFLRALAIGYPTIQAFSVNRQFIYSKCGDETIQKKYLLPFIGVVEAITYGVFGYGLIVGGLSFSAYGLQGSGYALSISNSVALAGSLALLFGSRDFRSYLLHLPDWRLIKKYYRETFTDGFPVMLRFVMENLSLVSLAVFAGLISQNDLSALQICSTLLLPITSLGFSFITGIKAEIILKDPLLYKKTFALIALPTTLALVLLPIYAGIPKQLSSLFLNGHTPESRLAIENINQKVLPTFASVEILNTAIHGKRAILQKAKDLWYPAGTTFLFLCAAFVPSAYVIGKTWGKGLPGMMVAYLICMFAIMIAMGLRFGYVLKNPEKNASGCLNPKRCWAIFFRSHDPENQPLLESRKGSIQISPDAKTDKVMPI